MDEARLQPGLGRQRPGEHDRPFREVHPGHARATPRPRERVQAEVALEVQQVLAVDVAYLVDHEVAQRIVRGRYSDFR